MPPYLLRRPNVQKANTTLISDGKPYGRGWDKEAGPLAGTSSKYSLCRSDTPCQSCHQTYSAEHTSWPAINKYVCILFHLGWSMQKLLKTSVILKKIMITATIQGLSGVTCGMMFSFFSSLKRGGWGRSQVRYRKGDSSIFIWYSSVSSRRFRSFSSISTGRICEEEGIHALLRSVHSSTCILWVVRSVCLLVWYFYSSVSTGIRTVCCH